MLRGEPLETEVLDALLRAWKQTDYEVSFSRLMSIVLSSCGYSPEQYGDVLFVGIPDKQLLAGIERYIEMCERLDRAATILPTT